MSNKKISVYADAIKNQKEDAQKVTQDSTQKITHTRDHSREKKREIPRKSSRINSRDLNDINMTREEIQEFTFHMRDVVKVKMQLEVPPEWREELKEIAFQLNVGKLELYRIIIGRFLGKTPKQSQGKNARY